MKLIWSPIAREELGDLGEFVSLDNPRLAARILANIFTAVERLKKYPESGRLVPELKQDDTREIIKSKHRIIYWLYKNQVVVLTVRHSRQKFQMNEIARARDIFIEEGPMRGLA